MGNQAPLQKHNKHPLGACLRHPIGSPLQKKKKKHPWGHVGAIQLALLTCFILMCFFFREKLLGQVLPMYGICFEQIAQRAGRENQMEQLKRWADYVHILSACLPACLHFCQRISRSRQAGRTHKRKVEHTEFSSLKISLENSERDERRGLTSIQNLRKSHKLKRTTLKSRVGRANWSALTFSD